MLESAAMNTPKEKINVETKNEYQCTRLVEIIERSLNQSIKHNYPSSRRCIYRVPDLLRKFNEEAYTPEIISIGPFHYGSQKLQSMKNYKLGYLVSFIKRVNYKDSKDLVSIIKDSEQSVRERYAGTIEMDSDDFMEMILVDACFIIEFFVTCWSRELKTDADSIELKPWQISRIKLDLILLENQLPFFIVETLYGKSLGCSGSVYPPSFLELTFNYFKLHNHQGKLPGPDLEIMHFVDLLRYFYLPVLPPHKTLPERNYYNKGVKEMYCASQLAEAGLKFKPSSSRYLLDLKFKDGVLEIPRFTLENDTEIYARNLMALEQCHYPGEAYVTDYFMMLDFLINTAKDVDLLVQKEIIVIGQGTNIRPLLPGNLCTGISCWDMNADYYDLCTQLVGFRRKHWYVILKSSLKQDYFRTLWMGAATVGAIILLILTLIQTVCAVISTFK